MCLAVVNKSTFSSDLYFLLGTDLGVFTTDSTIADWNIFNNAYSQVQNYSVYM